MSRSFRYSLSFHRRTAKVRPIFPPPLPPLDIKTHCLTFFERSDDKNTSPYSLVQLWADAHRVENKESA